MGIKKCGCGIGSSQDDMLRCGCDGNIGTGVRWSDNQKMTGGHRKLNLRSPLLGTINQKIVKCGCDLDYIVGGNFHSKGYMMLYTNTKNDYMGLNKFK